MKEQEVEVLIRFGWVFLSDQLTVTEMETHHNFYCVLLVAGGSEFHILCANMQLQVSQLDMSFDTIDTYDSPVLFAVK